MEKVEDIIITTITTTTTDLKVYMEGVIKEVTDITPLSIPPKEDMATAVEVITITGITGTTDTTQIIITTTVQETPTIIEITNAISEGVIDLESEQTLCKVSHQSNLTKEQIISPPMVQWIRSK